MSNCIEMFNYFIKLFVILMLSVSILNAQISDKRLCADESCSVPISKATTILRYGSGSPDSRILSFGLKEEVTIYSKSAGTKPDLWGVEIKGKRGYVPQSHIKENKIYTKSLLFEVPTEDEKPAVEVPSNTQTFENIVVPEPVKPPYEIHHGTTFYLNDSDISTSTPPSSDNIIEKAESLSKESTTNDDFFQKTEPLENVKEVSDSQINSVDQTTEILENSKEVSDSKTNLVNEESESLEEVSKEDVDSKTDSIQQEEPVTEEKGAVGSFISSISNTLLEYIDGLENKTATTEDKYENEDENEDESDSCEDDQCEGDADDLELTESSKEVETTQESAEHDGTTNIDQEVVNKDELDKSKNSIENEHADVNSGAINKEENINTDEAMPVDKVESVSKDEVNSNVVQNEPVTNKEVPFYEGKNEKQSENLESENLKNINKDEEVISEVIDVNQESKSENQTQTATTSEEVNNLLDSKENSETAEKEDRPIEAQANIVKQESSLPYLFHHVDKDPPIAELQNDTVPVEETAKESLPPVQPSTESTVEVTPPFKADSSAAVEESSSNLTSEVVLNENLDVPLNQVEEKLLIANTQYETTDTTVEDLPLNENLKEEKKQHDLTIKNDEERLNVQENNNNLNGTDNIEQPPVEIPSSIVQEEPYNENNITDNTTEVPLVEIPQEDPTEAIVSAEKNVEAEASARDILWGSSIRKEIQDKQEQHQHDLDSLLSKQPGDEFSCSADVGNCPVTVQSENGNELHADKDELKVHEVDNEKLIENDINNNFLSFENVQLDQTFIVLIITAVTIVVFLWGATYIDRSRKEGPLIAKINSLEKTYYIMQKENEILNDKLATVESEAYGQYETTSNEIVGSLKQELDDAHQTCNSMEEQIQNLEKELSNSTEVGLELNRMLSEFLNSENGSDTVISNIDQLQRQLLEQQDSLAIKDTENHELRLELDISNTKVTDLQSELNKMALNLLKLEEDKEHFQSSYEAEIVELKNQLESSTTALKDQLNNVKEELKVLKRKYNESERDLELKTNEYLLLKENISQIDKGRNNGETLMSLVDFSSTKAELMQLRKEKQLLLNNLEQESDLKNLYEKQAQVALEDVQVYKSKYDEADKGKFEAQTKLEVLSNYFKEKEAQLQKDLNKQENMWIEKQGEATSTIERIKYMQEELKNYKAQYESLKQEILAQEVDMKSQISVLEKRAHENWVAARQAERKLDDAKQEASQLRNRLTLRERSFDEKIQNRLQSPLEQNGDVQISPMHIANDGVPNPLLYRDHLTTSPPPLTSLPPFMPPPPGVPFIPPPLGGHPMPPPGFLPPPPSMLPGDHRPPPLGRMSSPPVNSRYSPDSRYSPFRRNSPSPTSDDDYDRSSPPSHLYRGYSPYNRDDERRDFNRQPPNRKNSRHNKGAPYSSGSANSNESLEKLNRHNSKV